MNSTSTINNATDTMRTMVILDKQCNGANPTVAQVLASTDIDSYRNLQLSGRFTVLLDRTTDINTMGLAGDGAANDSAPISRSFSFYKKCNVPLEFDASTGAITDLTTNNIFVLLISELGQSSWQAGCRVRFSDR